MKISFSKFLKLSSATRITLIVVFLLLLLAAEIILDHFIGDGNGRISHPVLSPIFRLLYLITVLYVFIWIWLRSRLKNGAFITSVLVFLILFLLRRIAFYTNVPFVGFYNDSIQYYLAVDQIRNGFIPNFDFIAPGFPLFMYLVYSINDSHIFFMLTQTLLTFVSSLLFIYAIKRLLPGISFVFVLLLALFVNNPRFLEYESAMLTECLYINLIIITISFLALALATNKQKDWLLLGLSMGITLWIRSAAIYLLAIAILVLFYQLFNKWDWKKSVVFIIPILIFKFSVPVYNYLSQDMLKGTSFSSASSWLRKPTYPFLETDSTFPGELNNLIKIFTGELPVSSDTLLNSNPDLAKEVETSIISSMDQNTIRSSWNLDSLHNIYYRYAHDEKVLLKCVMHKPDLAMQIDSTVNSNSTVLSGLYLLMSKRLIEKYPEAKYKYWLSGFYYYFFKNKVGFSGRYFYKQMLERHMERYSDILRMESENTRVIKSDYRLETLYQNFSDSYYSSIKEREDEILSNYYKESYHPDQKAGIIYMENESHIDSLAYDPAFVRYSSVNEIIVLPVNKLLGATIFFDRLANRIPVISNSFIMAFLFLIEMVLALILLIRYRFRSNRIWFVFLLLSIALLQAVLVSVTVLPHTRYSFQLEFIKYFTIPFLFVLCFQIPWIEKQCITIRDKMQDYFLKYF